MESTKSQISNFPPKADAQVDAPLAHKQIIRQRRMHEWMRLWRTITKIQNSKHKT